MNIFIKILFWIIWCLLSGSVVGRWVANKRGGWFHLIVALIALSVINLGILYLINTYLIV